MTAKTLVIPISGEFEKLIQAAKTKTANLNAAKALITNEPDYELGKKVHDSAISNEHDAYAELGRYIMSQVEKE